MSEYPPMNSGCFTDVIQADILASRLDVVPLMVSLWQDGAMAGWHPMGRYLILGLLPV
jgi:hypothetical protein